MRRVLTSRRQALGEVADRLGIVLAGDSAVQEVAPVLAGFAVLRMMGDPFAPTATYSRQRKDASSFDIQRVDLVGDLGDLGGPLNGSTLSVVRLGDAAPAAPLQELRGP